MIVIAGLFALGACLAMAIGLCETYLQKRSASVMYGLGNLAGSGVCGAMFLMGPSPGALIWVAMAVILAVNNIHLYRVVKREDARKAARGR